MSKSKFELTKTNENPFGSHSSELSPFSVTNFTDGRKILTAQTFLEVRL